MKKNIECRCIALFSFLEEILVALTIEVTSTGG